MILWDASERLQLLESVGNRMLVKGNSAVFELRVNNRDWISVIGIIIAPWTGWKWFILEYSWSRKAITAFRTHRSI